MKSIRRIIIGLSVVFLAICCGAIILFNWSATGLKALTVATGSMRPTIPPGSLVLMKSVPVSSLQVGDVVTYSKTDDSKITITHRIVSTYKAGGKIPAFVTKGDANDVSDTPIIGGQVKGKIIGSVPLVGGWVSRAKNPFILLPIIYICAAIITFDELKRLSRYYKSKQPYLAPGYEPPKEPVTGKHMLAMSGKVASFATVIALAVALPARAALQSNTVTLTPNNITVAPINQPVGHLLVQQVIFPRGSSCICVPDGTVLSVSAISGGTVTTTTSQSSSCKLKIVNNTWVVVENNNTQNASTGNANGSNAQSGNASNSNSTDININIDNNGNNQAIVIYNPTDAPVNLKNWTVSDNDNTKKITGNKIIAAHGYFVLHWPSSNELSVLGDHVVLKDPAAVMVDGVSWGTDTTVLNPSVTTVVGTTNIVRTPPNNDTDSAADWQVLP